MLKLVHSTLFLAFITGTLSVWNLAAEEWHTFKTAVNETTNLEHIADELGFFAAKKVKMEDIGVLPTGTSSTAALASGVVDELSGGHADSVVVARAAGAKVIIIGMSADATKDYPHMEYYVRANSPIHNAKDMIGKKVGGLTGRGEGVTLSGCQGFGTAEFFAIAGMDIRKANIEGVTIPTNQMLQAVKQGLVDIGVFHPPMTGIVSRMPEYRKVYDDYITLNHFYGKGATRIMTASERWIKRDPEGVKAFLAAMVLAADWSLAHEEESKWIFNKRMKYGLTKPEEIRNLDVYRWMKHQAINEKEDIQVFIDLALKYGVIKPPAPAASQYYTTAYNPYTTLLAEKKITETDILKEAEAIANKNYPSYINKAALLKNLDAVSAPNAKVKK